MSLWNAKYFRFCVLLILSLGLVVGCYSPSDQNSLTQECRPIKHALGETCVPLNPQRIVTLSSADLDSVLVLGMKPVGVVSNVSPLLRQKVPNVAKVGIVGSVNLEAIAALQPDLIIGGEYGDGAIYQQLSQIAPTVLDGTQTNGEWKQILRFNAKVLGKRDRAEALLREYDQRLKTFREQMAKQGNSPTVSLVRIYPNRISLYLKNSFAGTILEDAGLARPPTQNQGILGEPPFQKMISLETLEQADGDILFVWTYGATSEIAKSAQNALTTLEKDPLWSQLQAVQNQQVYEVDPYWNVSSYIAANAVIDDLFQYLIEEK